jgi:two-component system CheB/CheR fusion protein
VYIPDSPTIVQGSPVRLQQIIWNFLSNAIKFTEHGGSVSVKSYCEKGDVHVVVSDTGAGIAPDFLPNVFEPFSQGDNSLTRQTGGLGLGLAIAKKLAELHNGEVRAESEGPGKGASFILTMPLTLNASIERKGEEPLNSIHLPYSVMVIDDSADTLEMLETLFMQVGCRVMVANSAESALKLASAETPSIIISDIGMPEVDGYELLSLLRQIPGMKNVPAIAVSGYASEEDAARALAAGFSAHLSKPMDFDKLFKLIQGFVS